ncbi:hypothetical protein J2S45_000245 [Trueperella abortisuis]|uniref:Uncharacterized protein n=1 Tax=Trueperella abortisuis TaxID=445930 RepID=A0ABT9PFS8_9ACTO|nr:hypothetical protein [Trueperella abortisuis]
MARPTVLARARARASPTARHPPTCRISHMAATSFGGALPGTLLSGFRDDRICAGKEQNGKRTHARP